MAMLRELKPGGADFERFVAALEAAALPTDDLTSELFRYFTADDLAWGGLSAGPDAMLRSIVVLPDARGRGLGVIVTKGLIQHAQQAGAERLWLLTTSASPFFAKLGWRSADRAAAPAVIAQSRQFSELCPASATLMMLTL
jgi:GNAT superfamily N-acetyltransferase